MSTLRQPGAHWLLTQWIRLCQWLARLNNKKLCLQTRDIAIVKLKKCNFFHIL